MRERPILFSAPMVRAILEGRKTQTRRIAKGQALDWLQQAQFTPEDVALPENALCPHGFAGDRLWLRETFFAYGRWETRHNARKGRKEWRFVDMTLECDRAYRYAADNPDAPVTSPRNDGVLPAWWKRPAIHMPRAASRITLEIAGVRVERLQEISNDDAFDEGCPSDAPFPIDWYRELWNGLNAARGFAWDANPWVWVVEFRSVQAAGGP